ncbi:hypothetical protein [Streptomyces sp. NPDC055085]
MRDVQFRRRAETVGLQALRDPKPQWQDLFLAPAYSDIDIVEEEFAEEPAVDWSQVPSMPRRQRGGRRVNGRAV